MKNWVVVLCASVLSCACAVKRFSIEEVGQPIPAPLFAVEEWSDFDRDVSKEQRATIGDTMFVLRRYQKGENALTIAPPRGLDAFPPLSEWAITHSYKGYSVYTSQKYYAGSIGFLADETGNLGADGVLIQVSGAKAGRTWRLASRLPGKAFARPERVVEAWGLRYGGRKNDASEFQITDRRDASVVQVLQNIEIKNHQLDQGFVIRGVKVRLTSSDPQGNVVHFLIDDLQAIEGVIRQIDRTSPPKRAGRPDDV